MPKCLLSALSAMLVFVTVCASADDESIKTLRAATYAKQLQADDPVLASCDWNAVLVSQLVDQAKGKVEIVANDQIAGKYLRVETIKMAARNIPEKRKNAISVRADVLDGGKLIASMDFSRDDTAKAATPFCEGLRGLGSDLGEDVADWLATTRLPECRGTCTGIHPDEPIMAASVISSASADSINDTVVGCGWPGYMVKKIATEFNDGGPPPRAKLGVLGRGFDTYAGRRLILVADDIHVVGGGGFSGPKWINIRGQLMDGEMVVGSFEAKERGNAPKFTTCGALESLSDDLAKTVASWLRAPTLDAKL